MARTQGARVLSIEMFLHSHHLSVQKVHFFLLQQVGFECPDHSTCVHRMTKVPFVDPRHFPKTLDIKRKATTKVNYWAIKKYKMALTKDFSNRCRIYFLVPPPPPPPRFGSPSVQLEFSTMNLRALINWPTLWFYNMFYSSKGVTSFISQNYLNSKTHCLYM